MLLGPTLEMSEACAPTFLAAGPAAHSAAAWSPVAGPASETVAQSSGIQLNYDGLLETASRLFSPMATAWNRVAGPASEV